MNFAQPFIDLISSMLEGFLPQLAGTPAYMISWLVCMAIFFFLFLDVVKSIGIEQEHMSYVYLGFFIIAVTIGFIPTWVLAIISIIGLAVVFWRQYVGGENNG